jgi:nickel-dependent lactate racemase
MTTFFARCGASTVLSEDTWSEAIAAALDAAGRPGRILALPPDGTRLHSQTGPLTAMLYRQADGDVVDVMPALGTHFPMTSAERHRMFGEAIPSDAFLVHDWRNDLVTLGAVPAEYVHSVSEGILRDAMPDYDIPVQINRRLVHGGYDAIFSLGQVVPHEVVGMANGVKNILIGVGGRETINKTHFLGAAYGMERMMGRTDTPVRAVFNHAAEQYLADLPIIYILTVMGTDRDGRLVMRGLFVGDDHDTFVRACDLSREVNITALSEPCAEMVVWLDPDEYKSAWLGDKAIYRTRMALADGGRLTMIAPGIHTFGEDPEIDRLIRRYGYRGTPATLAAVAEHEELRANLSAAAHLIHGSSEGRFEIVLATDPALLTQQEAESVGFQWRNVADAIKEYAPARLADGPQPGIGSQPSGFHYISNPALGLWTA